MTRAMATAVSATAGVGPSGLHLVDCDVHPTFAEDWLSELGPFFPAVWRSRLQAGGQDRRMADIPGARYSLPVNGFYPRIHGNLRGISRMKDYQAPIPKCRRQNCWIATVSIAELCYPVTCSV